MLDLDRQIRDYFEATTHPVGLDDVVAEQAPTAQPRTVPHPSTWRGLLVAATAAVAVVVAVGVPLLFSSPLRNLPAPVGAWSLRASGAAGVGDLDLEFVGGYRITSDGVVFDGVSGHALTRGSGPLDITEPMTLSAWVSYADAIVGVPLVVSQGGVALAVAGTDWIFDSRGDGGGGALIVGPHAVPSDQWTHLVGVSDPDVGVIRLYIDGQLIEEMPAEGPLAASGPLIVSGDYGSAWGGAIVDVAAYQSALTSEQVAEIYAETKPGAPPPQWTLDPASYGDGALDGTWDYVLSEDSDPQVLEQLRIDYGQSFEEAAIRLVFEGDSWWQGFVIDGELWLVDAKPQGEEGFFRVEGGRMTIKVPNQIAGSDRTNTYSWKTDGQDLRLLLVQACISKEATGECYRRSAIDEIDSFSRLIMQHTYTRRGEAPVSNGPKP